MSNNNSVRHRFTVPVADTQVEQWIESQANLNFSLRVLIRNFVREYGFQDATCLEFGAPVAKRGRPPKSLKQHMDGNVDVMPDEASVDQEEVPVRKPEQVKPLIQEKSVVPPVPRQTGQVDITDMFDTQPKQTESSTAPVKADSDGFVDPEDLFK